MNNILNEKSYNYFLNRKVFKRNKICILVKHGYAAYGINLKDFKKCQPLKGICLNSKKEITSGEYEHFIIAQDKDIHKSYIDIIPLNTLVDKLIKCQPEIISIFGVRDEDTLIITPEGRKLKDNMNLFLNRYNVYRSFRGCVLTMKEKLEESINEVHRFTNDEKELNIVSDINSVIEEDEGIHPNVRATVNNDSEIGLNINLEFISIDELRYMSRKIISKYNKYRFANDPESEINDVIRRYAVNIIKTYLIGIDILQGNEFNTYMKSPIFDKIINNEFTHSEILKLIEQYDDRFKYASNNSTLQEEPDYEGINRLIDELNQRVLNDEVQ